jgi:hypothetical protein
MTDAVQRFHESNKAEFVFAIADGHAATSRHLRDLKLRLDNAQIF